MSSNQQTLRILDQKVYHYVDTSFIALNESVMLSDACKIMQKKDKDEIIVLDSQKKPIGIVTDEDILKKLGEAHANPKRTRLDDIMTFPLIGIEYDSTLSDALKLMRTKRVRKLAVFNKQKLVGMIYQRTLLSIMRQRIVTNNPSDYSFKSIIWNLGIVLQFAGILMLIPSLLATVLNDTLVATGIFLMSTVFLSSGFFLNSYGEKHPLNLRGTAIMVFTSFFLLVLVGTIPYLYVNPFESSSISDLFSNSFFSSASSFTTVGISLFSNPENLSDSFTFFTSFNQFVGGLSFIYLIMTAFYPENKIVTMRGFISGKIPRLKELFLTITVVFTIYATIISLLLFYFGERDIVDDFAIAMSALSTGGFVTSSQLLPNMILPEYFVLIAGMILGSLPFGFHYALIRTRFMSLTITKEISLYLLIVMMAIVVFSFLTNQTWLNSIFTVIATSTTAGYQIINFQTLGPAPLILLTILMIIGGCGFSTAGGIKVFRIQYLQQLLYHIYKRKFNQIKISERKEIYVALILLVLFPTLPLPIAYHLNQMGNDFSASYFESVGAITTAGLGLGVINIDLDSFSKILVSFLMIVGRLEIILIVYIFVPKLMT